MKSGQAPQNPFDQIKDMAQQVAVTYPWERWRMLAEALVSGGTRNLEEI